MATIHLAPGATVISGPTHAGYERFSEGLGITRRFLMAALRHLDNWNEASVAAHNAALAAQLAASDHRVLAELRAAHCRDEGSARA